MKGFDLLEREIVILEGARTPFASFVGAFDRVSALDLGVVASKEAM